jgi:dihydroflavonol-4-reductase
MDGVELGKRRAPVTAQEEAPVLLIGGTGFIGSAVARCLADRGVGLRCTVRPGSRTERLEGLDFEPVEADICRPETLGPALEGCRGVVHLASPSAWREIDSPRLEAVVDEGTRNLLEAARGRPGLRVVYVSSCVAVNGSPEPQVFDETSAFTLDDPGLRYAHTKRAAEALCREAVEDGVDVVVVNPVETYGPGDVDMLTAGSLVDFAHGPVALVCHGGTSVVHVDDVAAGIAAALEKGRSGERYLLGGDNLAVHELAALTLDVLGLRKPVVTVPRALLRGLGRAALRLGLPFPMEPRVIPYATLFWFFDHGKARRELGYDPRGAREVLEPTVRWLRETGRLG